MAAFYFDNVLVNFPISENCLEIHDVNLYKIDAAICVLKNLTVLKVTGCKLTMVPHELGLLHLNTLHLSRNSLGVSINWTWLNGKPLKNSLRNLDLSGNQLKFFPPQLVKYEKLEYLNLENNQITRLPFGIRRMRELRNFNILGNKLVSLPSTFFQMNIKLLSIFTGSFLSNEDYLLAADITDDDGRSNTMPIGDNAPLWLKAARVVCDNKLPFSYKTLPHTIVDFILEGPKCGCGKLCEESQSFDRLISPSSSIYEETVLCGKYCLGIKAMEPWNFLRGALESILS